MIPTKALLASDHYDRRYPYIRRVYNMAGQPWASAHNGRRNTAVLLGMYLGILAFVVFPYGAKNEIFWTAPSKPRWHMKWYAQYKDDPLGEKMFAGKEPYKPMPEHH